VDTDAVDGFIGPWLLSLTCYGALEVVVMK